MRCYFSLITTVFYVTNGITSVGINVGIYSTNILTCITCGVAIAGINVRCLTYSIFTYATLEPVIAAVCSVCILVRMILYDTFSAALITGSITGVAVKVDGLVLCYVTYRALIPVLIFGELHFIVMLNHAHITAVLYVTNSIAIIIENVTGYLAYSVTVVTGGIAVTAVVMRSLALLNAANLTLVPMLFSILVHLGSVCVGDCTLVSAIVTGSVTVIVVSVIL
jgi:hypothetical protein